jgi:phosphatidylglycerophosphatase A
MRFSENIEHISVSIATLGSLGWWPFGAFLGSSLPIPLLLLFRSLYWVSNVVFIWVIALSVVSCLVIVHSALRREPPVSPHAIVLDKMVGVMIAFIGIQLRWRVIFFGFLLFHFLNFIRPFHWYKRIEEVLEKFPGVLGIFLGDILSGVLVNLFLRLIAWVMG